MSGVKETPAKLVVQSNLWKAQKILRYEIKFKIEP